MKAACTLSSAPMSVHLSSIPDVLFGLIISDYLSLRDIVRFDSACTNTAFREHLRDVYEAVPNIIGISRMYLHEAEWVMKRFCRLTNIHILLNMSPEEFDLSNLFKGTYYYRAVTVEGNIDQHWAEVAKCCPKLEEFRLIETSLSRFENPVNPVNTQHNVTKLDLTGCIDLHDDTLSAFVPYCPSLQSLVLRWCRGLLLADFVGIFNNFSTITSLDISFCNQVNDTCIHAIAEHLPHLTSFSIMKVETEHTISSASLCHLLRHRRALRHVDIRGAVRMDDALCHTLATSPSLRALMLRDETLSTQHISFLARGCLSLGCLDISGCAYISDETLSHFHPPHFPALTRVVLGDMFCPTPEGSFSEKEMERLISARGGDRSFVVSLSLPDMYNDALHVAEVPEEDLVDDFDDVDDIDDELDLFEEYSYEQELHDDFYSRYYC